MIDFILSRLSAVENTLWASYALVYLPIGAFMNFFGIVTNIARFSRWWQVLTCYGLYMIPVSILVKDLPFHEQYLWGFFAMGLLEFSGYALGTSKALGMVEERGNVYVHRNLLAKIVNIKNFSLSMALFFGLYIPWGNQLVAHFHSILFG